MRGRRAIIATKFSAGTISPMPRLDPLQLQPLANPRLHPPHHCFRLQLYISICFLLVFALFLLQYGLLQFPQVCHLGWAKRQIMAVYPAMHNPAVPDPLRFPLTALPPRHEVSVMLMMLILHSNPTLHTATLDMERTRRMA